MIIVGDISNSTIIAVFKVTTNPQFAVNAARLGAELHLIVLVATNTELHAS